MAYLQARSGIARSGVTYAGWVPARLEFQVNATTRPWLVQDFAITETLDNSPGSLVFSANPAVYTPAVGQSVTFKWSTPNVYWFAGTIINRSYQFDADGGRIWRCEAVDNTWLLDRYATVTARYRDLGINAILARILASYTNGGFTVGYCPSTLGTLTAIDFEDATVSNAITRLADVADAYWFVDHERRVYLFDTLPDGNAPTVSDSSQLSHVIYDEELSQTRNTTSVLGGGSQTTAVTPGNSTTIAVDDTSWYAASGGQARAGENTVTYTGLDVSSGPGSLTGCSGVTFEIPAGTEVRVLATFTDTAAQTALATLLGGGLSGVAVHTISNPDLTDAEARLIADTDVSNFSGTLKGLEFQTGPAYDAERYLTVGQVLTVSTTDPITTSASLRIQSVVIQPFPTVKLNSVDPQFTRRVTARQLFRSAFLALRKA